MKQIKVRQTSVPSCFGFWSFLYSQKKEIKTNQPKPLLEASWSNALKEIFFPVCCIHLKLVVKYKRFLSEFPFHESICVDDLCLVAVSRNFARCNFQQSSRLPYWDYYQKFFKLGVLAVIQHNCHSWFLMFFSMLEEECLTGETNTSAVPRAQIESNTWISCTCTK